MRDTITTLVAPAARKGGTTNAPLGEVRLARGLDVPSSGVCLVRGLDAPSGKFRLARGLNTPSGGVRLARGLNPPRERSASLEGSTPPSARTASLEVTCTHAIHAPAPVYGHLMLGRRGTRATTLTRLGIASRRCFTNSLGEAILATM
jgi:hypothetical protein